MLEKIFLDLSQKFLIKAINADPSNQQTIDKTVLLRMINVLADALKPFEDAAVRSA